MKKITSIGLSALTMLTATFSFSSAAHADFGDFLLGVGAAAGTSILINSNQRAAENRYKPVSADQEYYRGVQDGTNGAKYDNPRNSSAYDQGYQEGLKQRRGR